MKKIQSLALTEIVLLVISLVAFSWLLGLSVPVVSAQGEQCFSSEGQVWLRDIINNDVKIHCTEISSMLGTQQYVTAQQCANGINENIFCQSQGADVCATSSVKKEFLKSCSISSFSGASQTGSSATGTTAQTGTPSGLPNPVVGVTNALSGEVVRRTIGAITPAKKIGEDAAQGAVQGKLQAFLNSGWGFALKIIAAAAAAITIYELGEGWLTEIGFKKPWARAIGRGAGVGFGVTTVVFPILDKFGVSTILGVGALGWGVIAGVIWAVGSWKDTRIKVVSFTCEPWTPPKGGEDCEQCNENPLGCSEYQCRSLGAGCELINPGTSQELCKWTNRNDVAPPVIQPLESVLSPDYLYTPDNTVSPPDRGVKIVKQGTGNGCVEPYFPLQLGIFLDEPGKCKLDSVRKSNFESMSQFFGGRSLYLYNHTQQLSLPSPNALAEQNITIANGGEMSLYVRCEDKNGNSNLATFSFNFCIDDGPDTTPPLIQSTSISNGFPIAYDQENVDLQVYVNEPSECKWSKTDLDYDNMENQMSCKTSFESQNPDSSYTCSTTLTGLKNQADNNFYFRCKDQPALIGTDKETERNKNAESYKFTLKGTQPLVISSLGPDNETIKDSISQVKVTLKAETSAGYDEGKAICYFSNTEDENYVEFYNTQSHVHNQELNLAEGDYTYYIRCVDLGGNSDQGSVSFSVESDTQAPTVVRVYHEENYLKTITDESATCVYSNFDCNYLFDDGTEMNAPGEKAIEHFTDWNLNHNFYIKCKDKFGNQPVPNQCSIIARPFAL